MERLKSYYQLALVSIGEVCGTVASVRHWQQQLVREHAGFEALIAEFEDELHFNGLLWLLLLPSNFIGLRLTIHFSIETDFGFD